MSSSGNERKCHKTSKNTAGRGRGGHTVGESAVRAVAVCGRRWRRRRRVRETRGRRLERAMVRTWGKKRKRNENTQKGSKQVINERAHHQGSKGKLQKKGRVERERESGLSLSDIHIKKRARQGVRWWGKKKRQLLAICGRPEGVKQVL